ncbi:N-acetylated-alpha-linked acidic dipeptidase 2-like [Babylonia areolata]|uniref:N-acetylated-alpha-linked acidic dipeptidase 2-like n=1 Tax=Babylonia areolata TaxID=304850 RepID=UPI003FD545E5
MASLLSMFVGRSMPTRGYIAGKPVSRWEASDSDNIDIEYKNLDRPGRQALCPGDCLSGPKGLVVKVLSAALMLCLGLVLGYVIRKNACVERPSLPVLHAHFITVQQDYNSTIRDQLQGRIGHILNFEDSIQTIESHLPLSGVGKTNQLLFYTRNMWDTYDLDSATIRNYTVQLMYPNYTMEGVNKVSIMSGNDTLFFTQTNGTNIHPNYLPFCAFSHTGHVRGDLVYGHYGRRTDFDRLKDLGVSVNQSIVLIRYGKIHPSNKVQHAERLGALGVILYPDPQDYTDMAVTPPEGSTGPTGSGSGGSGSGNVTGSWWLPGDAVVRSSVRYWMTGDPLTPDYPAVDGIPRMSAERDSYPRLPVFPVSFNDAQELMTNLSGVDVPSDWVGGLSIGYKTGPGYLDDREVDLNVKNEFLFREIHNIIATINGQYEKDQYVIVGAHIDSWTTGAIDAGTGYAALMDLVRTFSQQRRCTDWRPRRTIIFAGWDASKYGHVGAFEWAQEYEEQLTSGAVAYINLDAAVRGNYSFYAEANPLLYDVIYEATKTVDIWDEEGGDGEEGTVGQEEEEGGRRRTVYEEWLKLKRPEFSLDKPWISDLPGDSDHSPFLYRLGISSMSAAFTYNIKEYPNLPTYPVYGTLNDTYDYFHAHVDPDFNRTTALVRVLCDVILRLADSAVLPFNVRGYGLLLDRGLTHLRGRAGLLQQAGLDIELLESAKTNFTHAAEIFHSNYSSVDIHTLSEFEVRYLNDKMIRVSRAFVHPAGVMAQPWYRNILIAPHPENLNEEIVFPGVVTALLQAEDDPTPSTTTTSSSTPTGAGGGGEAAELSDWKNEARRQFAILVVCLQRARNILLESFPADAFNDSW